MKLSRKGKRLFAKRRKVKAKATLTTVGTAGGAAVTTEALKVKRKRS